MNAQQRRTYLAFKRVDEFVNTVTLPDQSEAYAAHVADVRAAIAAIERHASGQEIGLQVGATARARAARKALRDEHLVPLRRVARVLEETLPEMPHFAILPVGKRSAAALLAAARATVEAVAPYQAQFVAGGIRPDFLARLQAAIVQVEQVEAAATDARGRRMTASGGLAAALKRGRRAMTCLDTIVRQSCAEEPIDGPGVWSRWKSAYHVQVAPKHGVDGGPEAVSTLATAA